MKKNHIRKGRICFMQHFSSPTRPVSQSLPRQILRKVSKVGGNVKDKHTRGEGVLAGINLLKFPAPANCKKDRDHWQANKHTLPKYPQTTKLALWAYHNVCCSMDGQLLFLFFTFLFRTWVMTCPPLVDHSSSPTFLKIVLVSLNEIELLFFEDWRQILSKSTPVSAVSDT